MLDDFRQQASSSPLFDGDDNPQPPERELQVRHEFLGMTPVQRFAVAFILLLLSILIGSIVLLVTEKVVPPFLF